MQIQVTNWQLYCQMRKLAIPFRSILGQVQFIFSSTLGLLKVRLDYSRLFLKTQNQQNFCKTHFLSRVSKTVQGLFLAVKRSPLEAIAIGVINLTPLVRERFLLLYSVRVTIGRSSHYSKAFHFVIRVEKNWPKFSIKKPNFVYTFHLEVSIF